MSKPNQLFISHSNKDREFVEREIISLLRGHGVKVWYAIDDIQTAAQWQRSIQDGLEHSDWFLVVLSPRSVESEWVEAEVHWAMSKRKQRCVPVLMEDCDWQRLHLTLGMIQIEDFRGNLTHARRRLLSAWGISYQGANISDEAISRIGTLTSSVVKTEPKQIVRDDPNIALGGKKELTAQPVDAITNFVGMKMKLIRTGEFMMGTPDLDKMAFDDQKPRHRVRITKPFYLGVYPVTQAEYEKVMRDNPSHFKGNCRPVESISWFDAVAFCNRLSEGEGINPFYTISGEGVTIGCGNGYRLPTEAEWEYACRARTTSKWYFGDSESHLERYAWYSCNETHPVGEKKPNPWGLYDMHGNVWEWCWDWIGDYTNLHASDPMGPSKGERRVLRGGSFNRQPSILRSAYRLNLVPSYRDAYIGFRLAKTVTPD